MYLADRADRPGLDPLAGQSQTLAAVAVIAHLRYQSGLFRHAGHDPRFLDAVGHGLFHVNVLARPQRRSVIGACMWSGVAIITASMSFCFSSITR